MKIYVARHAEAEHNLQDLFHDTTVPDVPLTSKGIEQAKVLAQKLKDVNLDVIYVSELQRTQQTAGIVNALHGAPIVTDPLINDLISGMVGRPVSEFRQMLVASSDPWNMRIGTGESFEDEKIRSAAFLRMLSNTNYTNALIVTSGAIANIIYGLVHGLDNETIFNRPIDNTAVFDFELMPGSLS